MNDTTHYTPQPPPAPPPAPALQDAETYLPFVRRIAGRIARRLPQSVDMDDLVSAGTVGLMEALERYDPAGGRKFETYAEFRVKGAILDELRRNDPLNRAARIAQNQIAAKTARLTSEYGRPPETEEVAAAFKTSVGDFMGRMSQLRDLRVVSMDMNTLQSSEGEPTQEELVHRKQIVNLVKGSIGKLGRRQQLVLSLYYVEELTQAQIGQILGVSESRVCQILSEIVKRLRGQVARAQA